MNDHRKLKAFQLADQLVVSVYRMTQGFPREELLGLTSQIRRAAVSVPANIVEGCGRETRKEYVRFLSIAFGSLREVGYYIDLAQRLGFLRAEDAQKLDAQYQETARVLAALIKSLKRVED